MKASQRVQFGLGEIAEAIAQVNHEEAAAGIERGLYAVAEAIEKLARVMDHAEETTSDADENAPE